MWAQISSTYNNVASLTYSGCVRAESLVSHPMALKSNVVMSGKCPHMSVFRFPGFFFLLSVSCSKTKGVVDQLFPIYCRRSEGQ